MDKIIMFLVAVFLISIGYLEFKERECLIKRKNERFERYEKQSKLMQELYNKTIKDYENQPAK